MSCQHCVMAVQKSLSRLNLKKYDVSIGTAKVEFDEHEVAVVHGGGDIGHADLARLTSVLLMATLTLT